LTFNHEICCTFKNDSAYLYVNVYYKLFLKKEGRMDFQIFVKPVGSACNINCSYCYYTGKNNLYKNTPVHLMDWNMLEQYIAQHIEAAGGNEVMFSWHGGEPLLAGIDFYKKALELQRKHLPSGCRLINGIQTNGTLLDEEWCRFLASENFMAGISIDGPAHLHNFYRKDYRGEGTFDEVIQGYKLLQQYGITSEILCVVNLCNVNYPLEVYSFFKNLGAKFITFIPLVERLPGSPTGVTSDSVPAEAFGHFLVSVFDEWIENDIGVVQVQIFEEALRPAFNREHTLCIFKKECGRVPVVEHNGDFYACDHYVDQAHKYGNIRNQTLSELLGAPEQTAFGRLKFESLPGYCLQCQVKEMCNGECPKNRFMQTPDGEPGLNYLCSGYQLFFRYFEPFAMAVRQLSDKSDMEIINRNKQESDVKTESGYDF
jgi:uncharacterized protein